MRKSGFFPRLALVNLARNGRFYGPYLISCVCTAAMYYILQYLGHNKGLANVRGAMYLQSFSALGCLVAAVLAAVMLLYANNFVMKRRQRELGLYNILGLEKRHIAWMCFWETLFCAAASMIGGLLTGILFSKLTLLILLKIVRIPVQFGFEVDFSGVWNTVALFAVLFVLTLAKNLFQVGKSRPVDLLRSAETGEREPRTKWLLVVLGVLSLGGGYFMALTTANPVNAVILFFLAVGLVILGTYCLFTAGSIAVLKRLRANKKFYYQTRHFTAVSGLLYRMKQNAVGLASICILSTMVLVTVSTTVAINIGLENSLNTMFPYDIEFVQDLRKMPGDSMAYKAEVESAVEANGGYTESRYYNRFWVFCGIRGGEISLNLDQNCTRTEVNIVTAEDYARLTGHDVILAPDEVLACPHNLENFPENFTFSSFFSGSMKSQDPEGPVLSFHVREKITETIPYNSSTLIFSDEATLFLVVADQETAERIVNLEPERGSWQYRVQMNLAGSEEAKMEQTMNFLIALGERENGISFISKQDQAQDFYAMYGGFLFLGIFLGILFLLATVLIIYYKQISEGYEDQRRYQILRQVGMTEREVQGSIHSQILLVFFLPLGAAGLHILMAFPMLSKMMELFQLYDTGLFASCTAGTLLVFCAIYAVVFILTARTYSHIIGGSTKS